MKETHDNLEKIVEERTRSLSRANLELAALNAIAMTVSQSLDKRAMLDRVTEEVCKVLNIPRCSVILFSENKREGTIEAGYDILHFPGHGVGDKITVSCQPPLQQLIESRKPVVIQDAATDLRTCYIEHLVAHFGISRIAFIPLFSREDLIGVMVLDRTGIDPPFSDSEIHLMMTVAEQITVGVKNALLYDQAARHLETLEEQDRQLKAYAELLERKIDDRVREVRRLDRLSTLGELSAAIAHEIRNPLTGISSNAQLLRDNVKGNELFSELSENILIGVKRIDKIIDDILGFARPTPAFFSKCALDGLVPQTMSLFESQCRQKNIRLEVNCAPSLPELNLDKTQIQQVLANLILNALQATPPGGRISLDLTAEEGEEEQEGGGKRHVTLRITDTGAGIRAEHLDRIFDPFFTTKPEGTGLGLSISDAILKEHRADIRVHSEPGKGTTFILRFPPCRNP